MSGPPPSPRRSDRRPGGSGELGQVAVGQRPQPVEVEGTVEEVDVVLGDVDGADQHVQKVGGDAGGHLEPDRLTEPAAVQLELDRGQQVLGVVLLHRQIGVPGDPEGMVLGDGHQREDAVQVGGDHLLHRHQPASVRQRHQAGNDRWDLDPGDPGLPGGGVLDPHHQVEGEIGDVGERVTLVDGQGGQDGEDLAPEDLGQVESIGLVEGVPVGDQDAGLPQGRGHLIEVDPALPLDQVGGPGGDGVQLLGGLQPVGRPGAQTRRHLVLEPGHPHLEELVEALGENGQEFELFDQRHPVVRGQVQQPGPELQPRELAVDEPVVALERIKGPLLTRTNPRDPRRPRSSWGLAFLRRLRGWVRRPGPVGAVPDGVPPAPGRHRRRRTGPGHRLVRHGVPLIADHPSPHGTGHVVHGSTCRQTGTDRLVG